MKKPRLFYALLTIVAFVLSIAYKSTLTSVMFLFVLFLPPLSFLLLFLGWFFLRMDIQKKERVLQRGETFSIPFVLKNKGIIPFATVYVLGDFPYPQCPKPKNIGLLFHLPPLKSVDFTLSGDFILRGEYEIYFQNIVMYDPLHLFRLKKKLNIRIPVSVYPKILLLPSNEPYGGEQESGRLRHGQHNNIFSSLRDYREGDTLRHVHWKLTARYDNMIVRQQEENLSSSILILGDLNGYLKDEVENRLVSDVVVECALALSVTAMRAGGSTGILFLTEQDRKEFSIIDTSDYHEAYQQALYLMPPTQIKPLTELFSHPACTQSEAGNVFFITSTIEHQTVELFLRHFQRVGKTPVYIYIHPKSQSVTEEQIQEMNGFGIRFISLTVEDAEQTLSTLFQAT